MALSLSILFILSLTTLGIWLFVDGPYYLVFGKHIWEDENW